MHQSLNPLKKFRVDQLLVEGGYFESRTQAKISILAGRVRVGKDCVIQKTSEQWEANTNFIVSDPFPFVSRGALKLIPAMDKYLPRADGLTVLDIGASTGGFTDLMLQRGARKVYAVDVGYGQLHYQLRRDSRVICLEKVNARRLSRELVPEAIDVLTLDVSFISAKKILPAVKDFLKPNSWLFILIKPQFEAKSSEVGKGGILKSSQIRHRVRDATIAFTKAQLSCSFIEAIATRPRSLNKNIEYMAVFKTSNA